MYGTRWETTRYIKKTNSNNTTKYPVSHKREFANRMDTSMLSVQNPVKVTKLNQALACLSKSRLKACVLVKMVPAPGSIEKWHLLGKKCVLWPLKVHSKGVLRLQPPSLSHLGHGACVRAWVCVCMCAWEFVFVFIVVVVCCRQWSETLMAQDTHSWVKRKAESPESVAMTEGWQTPALRQRWLAEAHLGTRVVWEKRHVSQWHLESILQATHKTKGSMMSQKTTTEQRQSAPEWLYSAPKC